MDQIAPTGTAPGNASLRDAWIERVLGVTPPRRGAATAPGGPLRSDDAPFAPAALAAWQAARGEVVAALRRLNIAVAATKAEGANQLVVMTLSIIRNLTPAPASAQAVAELDRYLRTDPILADAETPNPFGIPIAIRAPLLAALARLQTGRS